MPALWAKHVWPCPAPCCRTHHQHHLRVGTPADSSTAPKGTPVYSFIRTYLAANYAEAWAMACAECRKAGKPELSWHNGWVRQA